MAMAVTMEMRLAMLAIAIKVKVTSGNLPPTEYHEKTDLLQEGQGN